MKLKEKIRTDPLSREEGLPIRAEIESVWQSTDRIELDFEAIEFVSPSFLDELVGKLFLSHEPSEVMKKVIPVNLSNGDLIMLGNIVNSRIKDRRNSMVHQ